MRRIMLWGAMLALAGCTLDSGFRPADSAVRRAHERAAAGLELDAVEQQALEYEREHEPSPEQDR